MEAIVISVYAGRFDASTVVGTIEGAIETFDYVDGLVGLVPHVRPQHVPLGAPVTLSGWALATAPGAVPQRIVAVLDATHVFAFSAAAARPDIARARGAARRVVGYRIGVPTDRLHAGVHHVRVYVAADDGLYDAGAIPFVVYAGPRPELAPVVTAASVTVDQVLDLSADGTVNPPNSAVARGRYALVSGWAMDPRTRRAPAGVTATDAQGRRWSAPCAVPRADIRAAHETPDDRLGFELVIPTRALPRGRHAVRIAAYRGDGAVYAHGLDVAVDVAAPQRVFPFFLRAVADAVRASAQLTASVDGCDQDPVLLGPASHVTVPAGARLTVEGWALAGGETAAEELYVALSLDEFDVPPHRYAALAAFRRDRPPAALGPPPVDDAWFEASFTTDGLGYRTHRAELLVVDRARRVSASEPLGTVTVSRPLPG